MKRLLNLKEVVLSPLAISLFLHLVLVLSVYYRTETKEVVTGTSGGVIMAMVVHEGANPKLKNPVLHGDLLPPQVSMTSDPAASADSKLANSSRPVSEVGRTDKKVMTNPSTDESGKRASSSAGGVAAPAKSKAKVKDNSLDKGMASSQRVSRLAEDSRKATTSSRHVEDKSTPNHNKEGSLDPGGAARGSMGMGWAPTMPYECNQYASQIKSAIERHMITDSSYYGRSCEVALQIREDGIILRANPLRGDSMVCRAAMRAIGISGSVPKPPNSRIYEAFKDIVISFNM